MSQDESTVKSAYRSIRGWIGREPTIKSVYRSISGRIERHRKEEGKIKDLYLSDESEESFLAALEAGVEITQDQVD